MSAVLTHHRLTAKEFYKMAEAGILTEDDRVELIEGELIDMSPMGPLHAGVADLLEELLRTALVQAVTIRSQKPLHLSDEIELEPDIVLVERSDDHYRQAHPTADNAYLVIEVSEASLRKDKEVKIPLYARYSIPEVWIVNLVQRCLEIYRQPWPAESRYRQVLTYTQGSVTPERFPTVRVDVGLLF